GVQFLGGQQRKPFGKSATELIAKDTDSARSCTVFFPYSVFENVPE
ncbi:MAG: hypothetical protein RLZZ630_1504, partial [Bacteroidota bacterium]